MAEELPHQPWKQRLYTIIYKADTPAGKAFDVALLVLILLSVMTVMVESIREYRETHGLLLVRLEWFFTLVFTGEYLLRILIVRRPAHYIRSGWGIIDLLSILPTYLSLLFPGAQALLVIRGLRMLRVFRVFKLARFVGEGNILARALAASRAKITVFLFWLIMIITVIGTVMFLVESPEAGFTSIPMAIYWAIVTMTTVGYGDIVPRTPFGQLLASALMIIGYSIIAVPTGIVTAELSQIVKEAAEQGNPGAPVRVEEKIPPPVSCPACQKASMVAGARFCCHCGECL